MTQTITITIKLEQCRDENGGVFHLRDAGTYAIVSQGDQEIGGIGACIGGGFEIALGRRAWFVSYEDIWDAFEIALELRARFESYKKDLAGENNP